MLDDLYTIDGVTKTAREFCDDVGLPYEVYEWRKKVKKIHGKFLFKMAQNIVFYRGRAYTLDMVADVVGLPKKTVFDRWSRGARGDKLFEKPVFREIQDPRERQEIECKRHLQALIHAHRDMAVAILKKQHLGDIEEPFDYSVAVLNAQRFVEQSRSYLTESTGYTWDFAA